MRETGGGRSRGNEKTIVSHYVPIFQGEVLKIPGLDFSGYHFLCDYKLAIDFWLHFYLQPYADSVVTRATIILKK